MGLEQRDLFGGALTALIPDRFVDASKIRQIPDNQEVFLDLKGTDQSLIIELLEAIAPPPPSETDLSELPATRHFWILAEENAATQSEHTRVIAVQVIKDHPTLPADAHISIVQGMQSVAKFRETVQRGSSASNLVNVFLCCVRLPNVGTDLVVSLNQPVVIGATSSSAGAVVAEEAVAESVNLQDQFNQVVASLRVIDWGLFGA